MLAGSTVTNTGPTIVTGGELGVWAGAAIVGFPPGTVIGGSIHSADPVAQQAQSDLTAAYNDAAGRLFPTTKDGNIGGQTLPCGVYKASSSLEISSLDLTLNGGPNDVFIFQIGSTLKTTPFRKVLLTGGAKASNVFWQVGSSATIDVSSVMVGTIMANASITMNTSATLDGRALARIAAVTLDSNIVTKPAP